MATNKNKRKLAAVTTETQKEHPRNHQSRNTSVPRINEEIITRVSEEIENRVTRKLYQEFNRTESRILGALSKLDGFLLNPQIRTHSGTQRLKTRNQMGIVPRMILILKWDPPSVSPVVQLIQTQMRLLTNAQTSVLFHHCSQFPLCIFHKDINKNISVETVSYLHRFFSTKNCLR